jgi:Fe2+ or Zn2+ uptake regulation protein
LRSVRELLDQFRQNGRKITPQRRAILEVLVRDRSHPTVDEIYQRVLSVMPDVSRTTVYSTLRELIAFGELVEVQGLSEGGSRYDTDTSRHHHLFCTHCHALIDIDHDFEGLILPPEDASGYQILRQQVTFYGICPDCQAEQAERGLLGAEP